MAQQDGKLITKIQPGEEWGHKIIDPKTRKPATYGNDTPEEKKKHLLKVSDNPPHSIYYREYGRKDGEPVIVVHGGPGGGCSIEDAKFLDPKRYHIILFDQRGNGESEPTVAKNPEEALAGNNTANLIADIGKLREHVGIKGKMHLFGGSWGSTLSLAYAIEHPEQIKSLQMRGIFLGRKDVFNYFYQGNAEEYQETSADIRKPLDDLNAIREAHNAAQTKLEKAKKEGNADAIAEAEKNLAEHPPLTEQQQADLVVAQTNLFEAQKNQPQETEGAYRAYLGSGKKEELEKGQIPAEHRTPTMARAYAELWDDFVRVIPKGERHDMVAAYSRIFETPPKDAAEKAYQVRAAKAWAKWEGLTSYLIHDPSNLGKFEDDDFAVNFARIENRYFMNGCYLGMRQDETPEAFRERMGDGIRNNNWIMDNLEKLKGIPVLFTHPPTDQVTLPSDADELFNGLVKINGLEKGQLAPDHEIASKDGVPFLHYLKPICGHSRTERPNAEALLKISDLAPKMTKAEKERTDGPRSMEDHAERGDFSPD